MGWVRGSVVCFVVAGCAPAEGTWFGELRDELPLGGTASVGERAFREHAFAAFSGPWDERAPELAIESADPGVVRAVAFGEIADGVEEVDPAQTVVGDPETARTHVWLETGAAGFATLSLVDVTTGEELDAVEVEVRPSDGTAVVPNGPWALPFDEVPAVLAGESYHFAVLATGGGQVLVGHPPDGPDWVALDPGPSGIREVAGVPIEVVDPADLVAIDLEPTTEPSGRSGLVAIGRDRTGRAVLGVPAEWTHVADPADRGDVFLYAAAADAEPVEVVARFGDLTAAAFVATAEPGQVEHTDRAIGCSSIGAGAGLAGLVPLLAVARRRARRVSPR